MFLFSKISNAASIIYLRLRLITCLWLLLLGSHSIAQVSFQQTTPLPEIQGFHGSAVIGSYLYVVGGGRGSGDKGAEGVLVARIRSDGTLATWQETSPLPDSRFYIANSTLSYNGRLYVLGGSDSAESGNKPKPLAYSTQQQGGGLSAWELLPSHPQIGITAPAAVISQGIMYAMGGLIDGKISNRVLYAPVAADGTLASWREASPLPEPRWFHNVSATAGNLYVWGGLVKNDNKSGNEAVFAAHILSDGSLSKWQRLQTHLPTSVYSAVGVTAGPYIISISPRGQGGLYSNNVLWAEVVNQLPTNWKWSPTTLRSQVYHSAAVDYSRGTIYVIGGKKKRNQPLLSDVAYYRLPIPIDYPEDVQPEPLELANQAAGNPPDYESILINQGFIPFASLRGNSQYNGRPQVVYFHTDKVDNCLLQVKQLDSTNAQQIAQDAVYTWVDVSQSPDLAQQYGVYHVPNWVFFNASGALADTKNKVLSINELEDIVGNLR